MNSVIVLFVTDLDEWIFSAVERALEKKATPDPIEATKQQNDKESEIDEVSDEKEGIALQSEQIASQQKEMESKIDEVKEEMNKEIELQKAQIATQQVELRMLRELVEKIQQSQAAATTTATASDSGESVSECGIGSDTHARQMEQVDEITMPSNADAEQNVQEPQAAASKPNSECIGDTDEDLQEWFL